MIVKNQKIYKFLLVTVCGIILFCAIAFVQSTFFFVKFSLDRCVARALNDWHVPGMAIAIVDGDTIVHIKGYGVLKNGEKDAVDISTIFAIGSCTKEFTAASLGMLVDENILTWDAKALTYLPQLQLPDEYMTKDLDIRDMLAHRSGLEEAGMLWDHTDLSRRELMQRMRFLKPVANFREGWVYNNLMYLAAGEIVAAITGNSWDDFIGQRIFAPLHMGRSSTTVQALADVKNVATPHYELNGVVHSVAYHNIDSISPAGGINSTIHDMAQWLKCVLNRGDYHGTSILKEETMNELYEVQAVIKNAYPYQFYGLGLGTFDYHCNQVVFHEGNIDGMSASIAFLPEKKYGVIILTNMHRCNIGKVIMNMIFDHYLHINNSIDWNAKLLKEEADKRARFFKAEQEKEDARVLGTALTYPLQSYLGEYHSDLYGDVVITQRDDNTLRCRFLQFDGGELIHWQNDTFTFDPSHQNPLFPARFFVTFFGDNKKINKLSMAYADVWTNEMNAEFVKIK